ncbi:MAG: threonylcarbamoyl-AMP synthase [Tannerella sp.]|jgi:L-threonylcarbamoyladenylate synthase|nr:threonylcarbamoyl-AMP synthase [Tannerella sp.]
MQNDTELFKEDVKKACEILRRGGIILYPTDTIWGIGCDAANESAVERIYALKQRIDHKAMLILIDSPAKLAGYVSDVPPIALDLIDVSDKPLTIIYPYAKNLALNLLGEDGSVGIRVTHERFSHELCNMFRKPIVSTSANISGLPSPGRFSEVDEAVRNGVDYVVRYRQGETAKAKPSSIIKLNADGSIKIIRE